VAAIEPGGLAVVALVLAALAVVAHRLRFLDVAGAGLAVLMGVIIAYALGLAALLLLFIFAGTGFLATRIGRDRKRLAGVAGTDERRGWRNVVGNGATATAVAGLGVFLPVELLLFPFAVAVAVAAADTLASEVGAISPNTVLITRPSQRVVPGTDGGVSVLGTIVSLIAAVAVAALAAFLLSLPPVLVPLIAAFGVAGSLLDSVLGALWESADGAPGRPLSKTAVNVLSISVPTACALLVVLLA
jgi:uncharacterized protein (TIGR00297 family)